MDEARNALGFSDVRTNGLDPDYVTAPQLGRELFKLRIFCGRDFGNNFSVSD